MRYALINIETMTCENIIIWDGESGWMPPQGFVAVRSDDINIGDVVESET